MTNATTTTIPKTRLEPTEIAPDTFVVHDHHGEGTDPAWVWDDEADPLVADLITRGDVPRVNELLRTWTKNGQPLPDGLPADLRDFMEQARRLPSWASPAKLAAAVEFNKKRGLYLGLLYGLGSGMMTTAIPHEARAVYYSKGGADMKDRISKTAKLGYDIGSLNAYQPDGENDQRRPDCAVRSHGAEQHHGHAEQDEVPGREDVDVPSDR